MDRRRLISGGAAGDALKRALVPGAPSPKEDCDDLGIQTSGPGGIAYQHFSFRAMACDVQFFFPLEKYPSAPDVAMRCVDLVEQIENAISVFRPGSDICRINQLAKIRAIPVGAFVDELIPLALNWHAKTGGAFDSTMGPLSRLWGFRARKPQLPEAADIVRTLEAVGSRYLDWNPANKTVQILHPHAELDFNGIGKGFVIGKIANALDARQIGDWMIHAGQSSVTAMGSGEADSAGWVIGVSHPLVPRTRIAEIDLRNQSLSTSGSARQAFVAGGKRYGHVLDPRTGWPAAHWLSMTVVHDCPVACDVLSTALFVMSPEEVERYVKENPDVKILGVRMMDDREQVELVARNFATSELTESGNS